MSAGSTSQPIRVLSASTDPGLNRTRGLLLRHYGFDVTTSESKTTPVNRSSRFDLMCWFSAALYRATHAGSWQVFFDNEMWQERSSKLFPRRGRHRRISPTLPLLAAMNPRDSPLLFTNFLHNSTRSYVARGSCGSRLCFTGLHTSGQQPSNGSN